MAVRVLGLKRNLGERGRDCADSPPPCGYGIHTSGPCSALVACDGVGGAKEQGRVPLPWMGRGQGWGENAGKRQMPWHAGSAAAERREELLIGERRAWLCCLPPPLAPPHKGRGICRGVWPREAAHTRVGSTVAIVGRCVNTLALWGRNRVGEPRSSMLGIPSHPVPPPQGGRGRCGALRASIEGRRGRWRLTPPVDLNGTAPWPTSGSSTGAGRRSRGHWRPRT